MLRNLLTLALIFNSIFCFSQNKKKLIKEGNSLYNDSSYNMAEMKYRKSLEKDQDYFNAAFNLADAIYKQNRFEESTSLFDALKDNARNNEDLARINHNLGNSYLKENKLEEAIEEYKSSLRLNPNDEETNIQQDNTFMDIYKKFNDIDPINRDCKKLKWVLRFEFNRKELMNKNISMDDIHFAIISDRKDSNDISCFYSDNNSGKIIFRIRLNESGSENDDKDIQCLKNYEKNLLNIVVKGIDKINKVIPRKDLDNIEFYEGNYKSKEQWIIDTDGTNLQDILAFDEVDTVNTFSNDITETYNIFGIDAAKQLLINEINEVLDSSGNYVNYRHLSLLCDFMTNKGYLVSIDRFGINRDTELGPLAKCSFEETTEQIFKASIFGEKDTLNGVYANIMMGQLIPSGTGDTTILLDEMKLLNVKREEKDIKEEYIDEEETYCKENIGIDFDINAI